MNAGGDHMALDKVARVTGGLYLAYIAAMVLADTQGHIGLGTAGAAARGSARRGDSDVNAVVCSRYVLPEVLRREERATPVPRKNAVRIRILATAVTSVARGVGDEG
jgi:hypothetical protein